jgi:hypothetical protein
MRRPIIGGTVFAVAAAGCGGGSTAFAAAGPSCGRWHISHGPVSVDPGAAGSRIAVTDNNTAWIVRQDFFERWQNGRWTVYRPGFLSQLNSQNPNLSVNGIGILSPNDIWLFATGETRWSGGPGAVAFHWDGQDWTRVPWDEQAGQAFDGYPDEIDSVTVASGKLWLCELSAVSDGEDGQFAVFWDGSRWSSLPEPPVEDWIRNGVEAAIDYMDPISPTNVWAYVTDGDTGQDYVYHWNGSDWSKVDSPPWWAFDLHAVPDANDAWALSPAGIWYWHDGKIRLALGGAFSGVRAFNARNVWAWGSGIEAHYDGAAWTVTEVPAPPMHAGSYRVAPDGDLWAAVRIWRNGHAYPGLEQYERCTA